MAHNFQSYPLIFHDPPMIVSVRRGASSVVTAVMDMSWMLFFAWTFFFGVL